MEEERFTQHSNNNEYIRETNIMLPTTHAVSSARTVIILVIVVAIIMAGAALFFFSPFSDTSEEVSDPLENRFALFPVTKEVDVTTPEIVVTSLRYREPSKEVSDIFSDLKASTTNDALIPLAIEPSRSLVTDTEFMRAYGNLTLTENYTEEEFQSMTLFLQQKIGELERLRDDEKKDLLLLEQEAERIRLLMSEVRVEESTTSDLSAQIYQTKDADIKLLEEQLAQVQQEILDKNKRITDADNAIGLFQSAIIALGRGILLDEEGNVYEDPSAIRTKRSQLSCQKYIVLKKKLVSRCAAVDIIYDAIRTYRTNVVANTNPRRVTTLIESLRVRRESQGITNKDTGIQDSGTPVEQSGNTVSPEETDNPQGSSVKLEDRPPTDASVYEDN